VTFGNERERLTRMVGTRPSFTILHIRLNQEGFRYGILASLPMPFHETDKLIAQANDAVAIRWSS
jgi:hypothetical protein